MNCDVLNTVVSSDNCYHTLPHACIYRNIYGSATFFCLFLFCLLVECNALDNVPDRCRFIITTGVSICLVLFAWKTSHPTNISEGRFSISGGPRLCFFLYPSLSAYHLFPTRYFFVILSAELPLKEKKFRAEDAPEYSPLCRHYCANKHPDGG